MQTRICLNASHMRALGEARVQVTLLLLRIVQILLRLEELSPYQEIIRNLDKIRTKNICKNRLMSFGSNANGVSNCRCFRKDSSSCSHLACAEMPQKHHMKPAPSISQGGLAMPFRDLALGQSSAWHKSRTISERKQGGGVGDLVRI